jgi:two-component system chemotaxis response regulator CheY
MTSCLVVDDSRVVRKVARRIVEDLGFQCEETEDGQQAYDACSTTMPDIILLDWNMPVMSGYDFLVQLRDMPDGTHPKVIFCTTENDMAQIQKAIEAGADEYIMKPFDSEIIESKFQQLGLLDGED